MLETRKAVKMKINYIIIKRYKINSAINGRMEKVCSKCKSVRQLSDFGNLKNSPDGLRYDCKMCRKDYRLKNSDVINEKLRKYYKENKETHLENCKSYRIENNDKINQQRKEYRSRPEIKEHIKIKNKEYLPVRCEKIKDKRLNNKNFQLSEILRSKIHKMIKGLPTSYQNIIGCDMDFLKKWIEFRFDENMNWDNLGTYWQIDHILPINAFDFGDDKNKFICFHWTNLQPLIKFENQSKSNKLQLHYYFNNIVNINRFNKKYNNFLGYEILNESLRWLRMELRYRENPPDEGVNTPEIGNQQPSL